MLVLSRKRGESICLPRQNVTVTVLDVSRNRVRIGITAPEEVTIYRQEIWTEPGPEPELLTTAPGPP